MPESPKLDLIVGAAEIAKALNIKPRQVYHMREAGHPLIRNEPGLGICMSKEQFLRHFGIQDIADLQKSA